MTVSTNKTRILTALLILLLNASSFSQQNYRIAFKIKGIHDTTCLIANYYGNGTYIKDTVKIDQSGRCLYNTSASTPKGMYIFVITDKVHFDFIINSDQRFSMETEISDLTGKMVVAGSAENSLFYEYLAYNKKKFDEIQAIQKELKNLHAADSVAGLKRVSEINQEIIAYKLDLIRKHPGSFMAFMMNAMKEPAIASPGADVTESNYSATAEYYACHFWDDTDFTDDRLLRTPVFHTKLQKYFDKVLFQDPDTLIMEIDRLITESRSNLEMFKYLIWFTTYHYENSEIMGFDEIFVHLVDTYYVTGKTPWLNQAVIERIIKKANQLRPILIGQKAPNMIMTDTSNKLVSMHNIDSKYLILLFWDPDCGHCEQEIPKLRNFYEQYKDIYGLKILGVCSDTSLVKWKSQIRKKNMTWINVDGPRTLTGNFHEQYNISQTPVIYILNSRKEIIAKNLNADQVPLFMKRYTEIYPEQ
ncbi:MAG: thioredoxin-like domain-containing protein [bacterium]